MEIPEGYRLEVKETCTDMDLFYVNILREVFTKAHPVIDHYHVIACANKHLDNIRRMLQTLSEKKFKVKQLLYKPSHKLKEKEFEKLNECFMSFSELKRAWKIVHQLRRVYWQDDRKKADSQLRKVIWYCNQSYIDKMISLGKTLKRWRHPILNWYISKTTNDYKEGIHRGFELTKRQHCGIQNFERFAKKLMFSMLPFTIIAEIFAHGC